MTIPCKYCHVTRSSFLRTVQKGNPTIFKPSLYDLNKAIQVKDLKQRPLDEISPKQYHEMRPLFSKVLPDLLPPHQPGIDLEVCLREEATPACGLLYSMSRRELVVLKEWLEENMSKGLFDNVTHRSQHPYCLQTT